MSGRESSDHALGSGARPSDRVRFTRWPGLSSLVLGLVLGPVAALVNQEAIYAVNVWSCGHGVRSVAHVVPMLCLAVAIAAGAMAYRDWKSVGAGSEDEHGTVNTRSRFLALLGIAISIFSSLVILAQWAAIFVFDPCMRA